MCLWDAGRPGYSRQARTEKNTGKEFDIDSRFEDAVSDGKTVLCPWETRDVRSWHLTKVEGPKGGGYHLDGRDLAL